MRKPSPATVIASVALFVACGGVGVAATGGSFILGQSNSANNTSALASGVTTGPTLELSNSGGKPAARFNTPSGVAPFVVNNGTKIASLNADKLDGIDSAGFVPSSAVRRVGPRTVDPVSGFVPVLLATFGQLSFSGNCQDTGTQQEAMLLVSTSANHAAYSSITTSGNVVQLNTNADFGGGFEITLSASFADGAPTFVPAIGSVLSPDGHQVSFNLYAGQNVRGLTGQKCVFGGSFVVN